MGLPVIVDSTIVSGQPQPEAIPWLDTYSVVGHLWQMVKLSRGWTPLADGAEFEDRAWQGINGPLPLLVYRP